ncbi:MAG: DUF1566 domain-containing protein, partial [Campylobacterales bacterium]|nr:DUF1566 domain-containing protein [Campylobacterales bacterium]
MYVDKVYPQRVEKFKKELRLAQLAELNKYANVTYLNIDVMWQDNEDVQNLQLSAFEAKRYCKSLNLANKKDWRLPHYYELLTLADYFRLEPAVIDEIEYIKPVRYWTISGDANDISANWYVDFKYGQTGTALRELKYNVRCIRNLTENELVYE